MQESPDIIVLVPASRSERVEHVIANFQRQIYERKWLLVVENGRAVGAYESTDAMVIRSEKHHSVAKNAGIEYIKNWAPHAFICIMDDDDIYGPEYLSEYAANAEPGVILGKAPGWVMTDDGLRFFHRRHEATRNTVNGGSMGFFTADAQEFPRRVAEEHGFLEAARGAGKELRVLSQRHFCYERRGRDHAYRVPGQMLFRDYGDQGILFNADPLDVIEGVLEGPVQSPRARSVA